MQITRRETLAMATGLAALGAMPAWAAQQGGAESLNALAQRSGRRFGSCVGGGSFPDPRYRTLLQRDCGVLVSENELKWQWVRGRPQGFDFARFDPLIDFAQANQMGMRGHTLLWHHMDWFPEWLVRHDFGANPRAAANVHEMPNPRAFADLRAFVDDGAGMLVVRHVAYFARKGWKSPASAAGVAPRMAATVAIAVRFSSSPKPRPARISS